MSSVVKQIYGVASGILATMRFIGQMVCMGIATLSFTAFMGNIKITQQVSFQVLDLMAYLLLLSNIYFYLIMLCHFIASTKYKIYNINPPYICLTTELIS